MRGVEFLSICFLVALMTSASHAALIEKSVSYRQGGVELEGFHVDDDAVSGKRPAEQVTGFRKEMNDAGAGYRFVAYSSVVHSFTHSEAGDDGSKGAANHEATDRRSWVACKVFFSEISSSNQPYGSGNE